MPGPVPRALADDLLDEVFVNVFANAVVHDTIGGGEGALRKVSIQVSLTPEEDGSVPGQKLWRVSIADRGPGFPDAMKRAAFRRYLDGARGSGLGLSIVHALVVYRYNGRASINDRVEGDSSKGARIDIWLPSA